MQFNFENMVTTGPKIYIFLKYTQKIIKIYDNMMMMGEMYYFSICLSV